MKHLIKRAAALAMAMAMTLTLTTWASAADYTDMPSNWAKVPMEAAVENGLLKGDNGRLRPGDSLTRAEMAAILVRAFGADQTADLSKFTDVPAGKWYAKELSSAVFMEIMKGSGSALNPEKAITREEAFAVLARALKLQNGSSATLARFTDGSNVSSWFTGEIAAMVEAGFVNGSDGKLNPKANISRQEFAQVMYNIFGVDYIKEAGTYSELGEKSVMINASGVTVKDATIHGDVIIGEGVGEGDVYFDNVTIEGRVVIRGGGVNSIHFTRSTVANVVIAKIVGNVRVVGDRTSTAKIISVADGDAAVVIENLTVTTVDVASADTPVEVRSAVVTTVNVAVAGAEVSLTSNTTVTTVNVAGTAAGSTIKTQTGVTVTTVNAAVNVTVDGGGRVQNVAGTGSVTDTTGKPVTGGSTGGGSIAIGGGSGSGGGGTTKPTEPEEPTTPEEHTHDYKNPVSLDNKSHKLTCSCGDTKIETHKWEGENSDTCACGATKKTESTVTPEGECTGTGAVDGAHKFSDTPDEGSTTATCTTDGVATYTCQNEGCSEKKVVTTPATGHTAGTGVEDITKAATCTEQGSKTVTVSCTSCKAEISKSTVTIPYLGHNMVADPDSDKAATCSAKGVTGSKKCDRAGCTYKEAGTATDIDPDAHNFDKTKKDGVCTYNSNHKCDHGSTAVGKECATCGMTVTCDHEWETTTPATVANCHAKAKTAIQTCKKCQATQGGEETGEIDPTNHDGETEQVQAVPGTDCQHHGTTAGVKCKGCNKTISGCEDDGTPGPHNWNAGVCTHSNSCVCPDADQHKDDEECTTCHKPATPQSEP